MFKFMFMFKWGLRYARNPGRQRARHSTLAIRIPLLKGARFVMAAPERCSSN
jgi:hypothetical protein